MNTPHHDLAPRSRRERPAKPALTREGIISAAFEILQREGLEKVTMRRVAAALDTGAASLYVYVRNTEDLHAQLLDALLGAVPTLAPTEGSWRERLIRLLTGYMGVLFNYPGIARLTMFTWPTGPHYLALVEQILELLTEGGVPDRDAAWAVDLLLHFATATAVEQGTRASSPGEDEVFNELATAVTTVDPATYPTIARLGEELFSGGSAGGVDRFTWGLNVLVGGILTTRRPTQELNQEEE